MTPVGTRDPRWVDAILDWRWTWLAARVLLTGAYFFGGVVKLFDFPGAIAEQAHFGLRPSWLWAAAAIAVELVGPVLIITGRFVWLGAGALSALTAVAALVADNVWALHGPARLQALNTLLEHIGLIAGFMLAALLAEHAQREAAARDPRLAVP